MAKARAIIKRAKAVQNIEKITHTMQLIATARFQKALNRANATRPYTDKITELVEKLSSVTQDVSHPLLTENRDVARSVLLLVTSNRGLCGAYNANVLRAALGRLAENKKAELQSELHCIGKKGGAYFRFLGYDVAVTRTDDLDKASFADVNAIATDLMDAYIAGSLHTVHVAYMRFASVGVQVPTVIQLLPIQREETPGEEEQDGRTSVEYDFSPPVGELMAELLPETVRVRLFQCFTDAAVSEHVARMVAMKAATDAARDMIKSLTQSYNRARQSQITLELLDIIGGAEALK